MILLTRINKVNQFYLNEDLIEFIEETPDTVITLTTGKKLVVSDHALDIIDSIIAYKNKTRGALPTVLNNADSDM